MELASAMPVELQLVAGIVVIVIWVTLPALVPQYLVLVVLVVPLFLMPLKMTACTVVTKTKTTVMLVLVVVVVVARLGKEHLKMQVVEVVRA
jgi:hypothetical protein